MNDKVFRSQKSEIPILEALKKIFLEIFPSHRPPSYPQHMNFVPSLKYIFLRGWRGAFSVGLDWAI